MGGSLSDITGCYNNGEITGTQSVGGIAGWIIEENITVQNCTNAGNVAANERVSGGIVGQCVGATKKIVNCINVGNITTIKIDCAGGILGWGADETTIQACYNGGIISGNDAVAGMVGVTMGLTVINECYNSGTIIADAEGYCSGLVGDANGRDIIVTNSVVRCDIINWKRFAGPLVNMDSGNPVFASCYYDFVLKEVEADPGVRYKSYVIGTDTESTAFSSDIWVQNSSTKFTSLPVPKSLAWIGPHLENNSNILQFLKNNGFTQAAA